MKTVFPKHILKNVSARLEKVYPNYEADSISYMVLEHIYQLSKIDILLNDGMEVNHESELEVVIKRLLAHEPIQYITGAVDFYGNSYTVNENVLIPRQETEELIQMIINENPTRHLKVLDIGTGSGCIACSLALGMNDARVTALDVSSSALQTAKKNAESLNSNVSFIQSDILSDDTLFQQFDIIVSNPPYVMNKEKQLMRQNVLEFEPDLALFVSDEKPLLFYRVITKKAKNHLNNRGKLYFEINEAFGNEVAELMLENDFEEVNIHKDLNGKDRFVSGIIQK